MSYTTNGQGDNRPERIRQLEVELDFRLLSLWLQAWEIEEWDSAIVGPFLRLAYASGYQDALTEARRGELYRTLRQPLPNRKRR